MRSSVFSVSRDLTHNFTKEVTPTISLLTGLGVEGDAHCGVTTQHRYLMERDPTRANLCQVHLIGVELYDDLQFHGWTVSAGSLGENITTSGIDLMALSTGTILRIGTEAIIEVTGKRSPCTQINGLERGLMKAVFSENANGKRFSRAGIMSIVTSSGTVRPGDGIEILALDGPFKPLRAV